MIAHISYAAEADTSPFALPILAC